MSTHKHIDAICLALSLSMILVITGLLLWKYPQSTETDPPEYAEGLFDTSAVHTIDIQMDDWESFLATCENEEYALCDVTIDGTTVSAVGLRAKGNTSLSSVRAYGNDRYSFKLEFDQYRDGGNYQGLDKLSLNNLIQDNTLMKDYLTYQLMEDFGVDAPLCSYVYLTVNGEDWGLYLAVEAVEDSFLDRNYGGTQGDLYKPDSMSMGGEKGFGGDFEMPEEFQEQMENFDPESFNMDTFDPAQMQPHGGMEAPEGMEMPAGDQMPGGMEAPADGKSPDLGESTQPQQGEDGRGEGGRGGGGFSMGSDDVKLVYTDDDPDSYANIFNNAKTDVTDADEARLIASLKALNDAETADTVVNVEEVIRYFVVHNFVCNFDSYTGSMIHNYYLYEEDGVLSMIPWDYNLAFGAFMGMGDATEMVNFSIDQPVSGGDYTDRPMLSWILDNEEYKETYHAYFADFLSQYYDTGWLTDEIQRVQALIAPYVEQDPTKFCTYEEFETGVSTLVDFCALRCQSIQYQLAGIDQTVDASHLSISDMGSMGNMGGPDGDRSEGGKGEAPAAAEGMTPPWNGEFPQNLPDEGGQMSPPANQWSD